MKMENAVLRPFFEEPTADVVLAPVIPMESIRVKVVNRKQKSAPVKAVPDKPVPAFTGPVFKPKKHDLF
jgi:hypothetical protein